ncbi:MAG: YfcC family protein [Gemmatimonadetes bacterium]|nr:YfcC family protein [Gemmatimonadota bacterium]
MLMLGGVAVAAALTWLVPAGEYERVVDAATGRTIAVAGTYHAVPDAPVGPFAAVMAVPRGIAEGIEVILTIFLVGGAWYLVDKIGTLGRAVNALASRFREGSLLALPLLILFFSMMGAAENMQEEIIALIPVLLVLGSRLGVDAVTMVAASAGAAMIGSAFGPTNPFQAGIAMKLAELPTLSGGALRTAMWIAGTALWTALTLRWASRHRVPVASAQVTHAPLTTRDGLILACVTVPLAVYIYGALQLDWGFNELSSAYFIGAILAGVIARLKLDDTIIGYLEGMQLLLPAALLVGVARSITVVLQDGHIIDTILYSMATPLANVSTTAAALLMVPLHALLHIPVSSVSGQAALTMPIMVPLSDLLGVSRQATVLAYQVGAGLCELLTPTNGALMAVLLAAKVPFGDWLRFATRGYALMLVIGIVGILVAVR